MLGGPWLELIALVGGTVHSMAPGVAPEVATVVIDGERIVAVGRDVEIPEGARRIDASGWHLIPGLIDGFAYFDPDHDPLYVAAGVTLVRDHGNDLGTIFDLREGASRERIPGPALSIAGAVIDGMPPSTSEALILRDAQEVAAKLPQLLGEEVDFLAFQSNLSRDAWHKLIELAHAANLQVWGPAPEDVTLARILELRQDGLLFLDALRPPSARWDQVQPGELEPTVLRVAEAGLRVVPLLRASARLVDDPGADAAEFAWLGPQYVGLWRGELEARRKAFDEDLMRRGAAVLAAQRALVARLHRSGVPLVPGSGAPHPWLLPGRGLHRELAEWQAAGIEPREVLRLATAGAASALALEDRGTIEPGKIADLVALARDPAQGAAALEEIAMVVVRGRALAREDLDALLERARREAAREQAAAQRPVEVQPPRLPEGEVLLAGYSESGTPAGRLAGERWAVVREADGAIDFCGRRVVPGGSGDRGVEVEVRQRLVKGELESFQVALRTAGHELVVRGLWTANRFRVERRRDGAFLDNDDAREHVAAVDVGSLTTLMLVNHARSEGKFPVLVLQEGLQMEVVGWKLDRDEKGDVRLATHEGLKLASFRPDGSLVRAYEQKGSGAVETITREVDDRGGAGLPVSEAAKRRVEASAPTPPGAAGGAKKE
jgi:hypothetical protein